MDRLEFFRAVITALFLYAHIPERTLLTFTVHLLAQSVVNFKEAGEEDDKLVTIEFESILGSTQRVKYYVPGWMIRGVVAYYLEVRSHFLPVTGATKVTRRFADGRIPVETESVFYNSAGSCVFRVSTVAKQFTTKVKFTTQSKPRHKLNSRDIQLLTHTFPCHSLPRPYPRPCCCRTLRRLSRASRTRKGPGDGRHSA